MLWKVPGPEVLEMPASVGSKQVFLPEAGIMSAKLYECYGT